MISNNKQAINTSWLYRSSKEASPVAVELPHANREVPLQYFDEADYQFISYYQRALPTVAAGKRAVLQFDGVMTAFTATVNGTSFPECRGGYLPHRVEVTGLLHQPENQLSVMVDSHEREDIPPFGYAIDYLTFGGIYRDVWLFTYDRCFIENCLLHYSITSIDGGTGTVTVTPEVLLNHTGAPADVTLTICVANKTITARVTAHSGVHSYTLSPFSLAGIALWDIENPVLHIAELTLLGEGLADAASISVGFRSMELTAGGAILNGRQINLVGLNRHQSFPYVGYAMPRRAQERDAQILKQELGLNTVRSSHYPPSPWFLDECDRQGLLVLEELAGWQHISQRQDWRESAVESVREMVLRDFNHPSVITWGVRINESQDDDELYTLTNAAARALDPARPTSGVRCIERSHLLEDIYTMNDFIHDGGSNILRTQERCTGMEGKLPYMITEFCGHTYPTKRYDQEERLIEHALRHGRVQSLASQKEDTMGAIGWCAFDYNTHYDFGSGDRICYHGVMDAFRISKFAAAVYASQRPMSQGYVLEPLTHWTRGERDRAAVSPIYVFTNCNKIAVKMNGKAVTTLRRAFFNVHPQMQFLTNPPFVVEINGGDWGEHLPELTIEGLDERTNEVCIVRRYAPNPIYSGMVAIADDQRLHEGEQDVTRIVVKTIDQVGNHLPFLFEALELSATSGLQIIGQTTLVTQGGVGAFWVRTAPQAPSGRQTVTIRAAAGHCAQIEITIGNPRSLPQKNGSPT